jgi:hypothetical protein
MDEATKKAVRRRAAGVCEYCHLPEAHVLTRFTVEHVIPRKHGGSDDPRSLAYACLRCNLHKGTDLAGLDLRTRKLTRLFSPRRQLWTRHFRYVGATLLGKTAVGRTTALVLNMNDPPRVRLRQELIDQGLFPS